jgi:hypothetical protein
MRPVRVVMIMGYENFELKFGGNFNDFSFDKFELDLEMVVKWLC